MTAVMTSVTNTTSNRTKPRAELREAIYRAALDLFRDRGFAAASVDEIVAAAGVAKGTFFNFFPTKAHVLRAYYAEIDVEVARIRKSLDPMAPLPSLLRYARGVERVLLREGRLMTDLLDAIAHDPRMRAIDEDSGAVDAEEFADFLRRAREAGTVAAHVDVACATVALMDLWSGAVRVWTKAPAKGALARLFGARLQLLFEGIGA